jgi:uncharacterized protein (PEP-CTERM system associated)
VRGYLRQGRVVATALFWALATGCGDNAQAQTVDYFSTPWIFSPLPPNGASNPQNEVPSGGRTNGGNSSLYARSQAQSEPNAPPWIFTANLGIDEIATDNVAETKDGRIADLGSLLSAGASVSADSTRLYGILSATAVYRRQLEDTALDGFSGYGYGNGRAAIIPGMFYFNMHGLMDEVSRVGGGIQNPLVQTSQETQVYSISGSPILSNSIGDFARNVARYQIGQTWFSNNTGALQAPGLSIGPITSSTSQTGREDFKMAGTLMPRLMSDMSLSGTENDSGASGSGMYTNLNGELINEYEVTRYLSAIGGAGYERLHDDAFSNIDGEGAVWDIGMRLRPNADSHLILTYGRHNIKSDFAGELRWDVTDLTTLYAAYTDSITNSQASVLGSTDASQMGPDGAVSGVAFDQSTLIGTLDDSALNEGPGGGESVASPFGVPLADINDALPLQNGLFRDKSFRATGRSTIEQNTLSLTIYHAQTTQLTRNGLFGTPVGQVNTSDGAIFSWSRTLVPGVSGTASLSYTRSGFDNSNLFNTTFQLTKELSRSFSIVLRYDLIHRDANANTNSFLQNAVTIGLHKTLD